MPNSLQTGVSGMVSLFWSPPLAKAKSVFSMLLSYLVDTLTNRSVFIHRQNRFVNSLNVADNQQSLVFVLKGFAALEFPLMVIIDNYKELITQSLGVIKILQMPFVQRIKIARYDYCLFFIIPPLRILLGFWAGPHYNHASQDMIGE